MERIDDGRGYIDFRRAPGSTAEIVDIEVYPEHRRHGVGKRMLYAMFDKLHGVRTVYAITRQDNYIAQQFYESCGFVVAGTIRDLYDSGAIAVVYTRQLF